MRNILLTLTLGITVLGCRASGPNNTQPDAPANGSADAAVPVTSIKAIRMNQPTNGAAVSLANVVVVGGVTSKKYGHLWVQDQGGGQYSGIQLYCNYGGTKPNCGMTQAQIDGFTPGTVLNVTGNFSSFLLNTAPAGAQPVLEIDAPVITASGGTMTPVAVDVAASVVAKAQLMGGSDPYKGTYIHVTGATTFTASNMAATEYAMTCTDKSTPTQTGATFGGFEATGGSQTLTIGLSFYKSLTKCLPCTGVAMPYPCVSPDLLTANQTFSSIKGVVEPQYKYMGTDVFLQIAPVTNGDLAP